MTQELLDRCNVNRDEYQWCKRVREHYLDRLKLRFDTTRDCIENHTDMWCPEWLNEMIFDAVKKRQEELEKEFADL